VDDFKSYVSGLINYLSSRKMCSSSVRAHEECYETLIKYLEDNNIGYSKNACDVWLRGIQSELVFSKFDIWVWYVRQLNEFLERGAISDGIYYLNQSCYDRLSEGLRRELDLYFDECKRIYTKSSFRQLKIQCSSIMIILTSENSNIRSVRDISYADIEQLSKNDYSRKSFGRNTYMNYAHKMFAYFASQGLCPKGYGIITGMHYNAQVGNLEGFSGDDKETIYDSPGDNKELNAEKFYSILTAFLQLLDEKNYSYTVKKYANRSLTALYLFIDKYELSYTPIVAMAWFNEIKECCGVSWRSWRRVIRLFEEYYYNQDIPEGTRYLYSPGSLEKYTDWCREAILGFQDRLRREFRKQQTIRKAVFPCMRFCSFILNKGLTSFKQITPELLIEYCLSDEHSTFKGRASYINGVKSFIYYLEDSGIIESHGLHKAMITGTATETAIVDILSDSDIQKIHDFKEHAESPKDLRKAAMVLIGLKTGLRASDIINLKIGDIDWKNHTASIVQQKTEKPLTLPLPNEVGNAIYKYMRYGRPKSESECIFIRHAAPYCKVSTKICTNALYAILPERKAVNHKGFHVTRRTFATNILKGKSGIDAVMTSLGHTDNTTVMKYLSFDSEGMKKCPLSLKGCDLECIGGPYGIM